MKRYDLFAALGIRCFSSSAYSASELLASHQNKFFEENHSGYPDQVTQSLKQIGTRAEKSTNSVLCDQLSELLVEIEFTDSHKWGLN